MRTRTTTATLATALLLATLTACSSGGDSSDSAPASSNTAKTAASSPTADEAADLKKAISDYTAALFSGDASGYKLVSARCQKQMPEAEWVGVAEEAHQQYGSQKATDIRIDQQSGDLARVSYGAGNIPQFDREGQSWTREGGTWRWDACPSTS